MQPATTQYGSQHRGTRVALAVAVALLALLLFGGSYVLGRQSAQTGLNATAGVGSQGSTNNGVAATPGTNSDNSTNATNSGGSGGSNGGGSGSGNSGGSGSGGSGGSGNSGGSGGSGGTGGSGGSGGSGSGGGSNNPAPTPTPAPAPAHISVSPDSIVLHIGTDGASTTRTLTISNSGDVAMSYQITGLPSFASLSGDSSGTVAPHSSKSVTINFLMTGLGLLTRNITINNSSANAPVVTVPVTTKFS